MLRVVLLFQLALTFCALCATTAIAEPATFPRGVVDQGYTTTQANTPAGLTFSATYHAAGDPKGPPPYMRKMIFYPPAGARFDTNVPDQCKASDLELEMQGPAACPPGSLIGEGKVSGIFYMPLTHSFEFDRFEHHVDVINNANEQILLIHAEDYAVARGKYLPDGSIEFDSQTCYPEPPTGCLDDYVLQVHAESLIPVYTNSRGSYLTTPPTCPSTAYWATTIRFWWADGATDSVVSKQPCTPTAKKRRAPTRRTSHRRHTRARR